MSKKGERVGKFIQRSVRASGTVNAVFVKCETRINVIIGSIMGE